MTKESISSFDEGLPQDYAPQDIHQFSDLDKLKSDYDFRYQKLKNHFAQEKELLKNDPELEARHQKVERDFHAHYKKLEDDYEMLLREQKSSERKGLR